MMGMFPFGDPTPPSRQNPTPVAPLSMYTSKTPVSDAANALSLEDEEDGCSGVAAIAGCWLSAGLSDVASEGVSFDLGADGVKSDKSFLWLFSTSTGVIGEAVVIFDIGAELAVVGVGVGVDSRRGIATGNDGGSGDDEGERSVVLELRGVEGDGSLFWRGLTNGGTCPWDEVERGATAGGWVSLLWPTSAVFSFGESVQNEDEWSMWNKQIKSQYYMS